MTSETVSAYRLPYDVTPRRYLIHLAPDLEAFRFDGELEIEIEVENSTDRVVCNSLELEIHRAELRRSDSDVVQTMGVEFDVDDERVAFVADAPIVPGAYRLSCSYTGTLNDKMHGFYRSTYTDVDGIDRVMAVTQFEAADARRCLPCFDEPDRKASFVVTIDVPPEMSAVSNGPEIGVEKLDDGRRRVRFGETPVMSTYLFAVVVGRLEMSETLDVDGIPVRVVTVAGKSHLHEAALEASEHALRYFRSYFALPYLGEKLDLIAVPDFAFGAMENVGCVTFRESILLADSTNTSRPELERLVEVTSHELAHMWFGDLVTMRWWNGLWLNESFATFMALCCSDDYHPEWNSFVSFARDRASALAIDALHATRPVEYPARTPADAEAMVDTLTYEKGASVLWMIESFIGRETFRAGIRRYLADHQFANAETTELWDAIGHEVPELPIRALMDSWIFQGGVPLITARAGARDGATVVELAQEPFTYLADPPAGATSAVGDRWLVPLIVNHGPKLSSEERLLLDEPTELAVELPLLVNAGGSGYYRVAYDDRLFDSVTSVIDELAAPDRYSLTADTWALCVARRQSLRNFLVLVDRLGDESDPNVLGVVASALTAFDLVGTSESRAPLAAFARRVFAPVLERVGAVRRAGEELDNALVRARAIAILGAIGEDSAVIDTAREAVRVDLAGGATLDPDLASAQLAIFAAHADGADLDALLERVARPRDPKDESRVRSSFSALRDTRLAQRVLERCLDGFRSQDVPYVISPMMQARPLAFSTFAFVEEHFAQLHARVAEYGVRRILDGVTGLACLDDKGNEVDLASVRAFCEARVVGAHSRHVAQALERLEANIEFAHVVRRELVPLLGR